MEGFSIIMPTYNQATYIRRAIKSLLLQTYENWELIIINDGATDDTEDYIKEYLSNEKIRYIKNEGNKGLGYAINQGLEVAGYAYIAYLPSDDYYYENHLMTLYNELRKSNDIILCYSNAKSEIKDSIARDSKLSTNGLFNHMSLQLVQTAHKRTDDRWTCRDEYVNDNLFNLFWRKLIDKGVFSYTGEETACWTIHTHQRHRLINEDYGGGLNIYRQYYNVQTPIRMKVSKQKFINEVELYKTFRKPLSAKAESALKILIVGELAYNPERIYALEEKGHKLYGLWMNRPTFSFSTVGHLPFGNVIDIPYENWEEKVKEIQPDIIYATLNFGAVLLAHEVLKKVPEIPFVWHFKEGPFLCRQKGTWEKLIDLYNRADGKIYLNPELKVWYEQFITEKGLSFILDGDLPKEEYFTNDFSDKLSDSDYAIHTVIPGRIIGLQVEDIKLLAENNIHIHMYVENYLASRESFIKDAIKVAPEHFHTHPHCSPERWVNEFSKYDAGWLHCFESKNNKRIMDAGWDDLNMPARMNTLAAAGLPMIQKDNSKHIVAMQSHIAQYGMGIFYKDIHDLIIQLKDKQRMNILTCNALQHRSKFSFDYHADELIRFFKKVIASKNN
ncbi:glycosyltransferase family 2 protein [Dysgonomonas sp. 25]|uniref:glycosyltransferase family 2 protein n=1 Tax=Dysgonomonas sp. 25 TaxID=2302933 RepID=UPI0013D8C640|nr:glycosyltransferase family 2 protein [Dysgonomonas sp. 25]NDV67917.1 glycosyltransferase [Dysgonomonas sp. 25]